MGKINPYQPQPPDWKLRSNDPTGSQATETDQLTKKPPELPSSAMERLAADYDKIYSDSLLSRYQVGMRLENTLVAYLLGIDLVGTICISHINPTLQIGN